LLADPRRFRVDALTDFLWLCPLDVPRALAARSYGAHGKLVLEVTDPFPVPRTTRYLLSAGPDRTSGAECVPTQAQPDLALDLGVLGTTYLGGTTFASLALAGRVLELRAGALEEADAMFRTGVAPYCLTDF
jgi:predicted acetyltransferase